MQLHLVHALIAIIHVQTTLYNVAYTNIINELYKCVLLTQFLHINYQNHKKGKGPIASMYMYDSCIEYGLLEYVMIVVYTYLLWCRHTITIRPAHVQRFANFTKYFDKFQHVQICRDL